MICLAGLLLVALMVAVPAAYSVESPKVIFAVLTPATAAAVRGSEGGAGFALTGTPALERALTQAGTAGACGGAVGGDRYRSRDAADRH